MTTEIPQFSPEDFKTPALYERVEIINAADVAVDVSAPDVDGTGK